MKSFFTLEINQKILKITAFYSILLGFFNLIFPEMVLKSFGVHEEFTLELLQIFGIITGAMGIGYFIASLDPIKNWPIIFIGLIANILSSLIFLKSIFIETLPVNLAIFLLISSLIWSLPFYYILLNAYDENTQEGSAPKQFHDLINFVRTSQNKTLYELSVNHNILLVFVRHFGCTFCRETVSELAKIDKAIVDKNLTLVFVHMSDRDYGDEFFSKYYDHPVHHISDPGRALYKSLNLKRGTFYQIFGPKTWIRGIYVGLFKGYGLGKIEGDSLQLGGVFILSKGQIVFEQKAKCASDQFHFKTLPEL